MFRSIIIGGALALGLAGTAVAEPFQTFADHCLAGNARQSAVAAGLAKGEWFPLPEEMLESFKEFDDPEVFMNVDPSAAAAQAPADLEIVILGQAPAGMLPELPGSQAEICGVLGMGADAGVLREKLARRMGFDPVRFEGDTVWLFSNDGSGPRSEAGMLEMSDDDALALLRARDIYLATAIEEEGLPFLLIAALRPAN